MLTGIRKLFRQLKARRRVLVRGYAVEELHQLRVTLRRIRSLLKNNDRRAARRLRRDLGKLAATTNAARDWDSLVIRARASLDAQEFKLLQPWLEEHQLASHHPVLDMLRSEQWLGVMHNLKKFIGNKGRTPGSDADINAGLSRAKEELCLAWSKVQSMDDNKHWHKVRLAIKELRYNLQNVPSESRHPARAKMLQHCKQVQENLGNWDDTVVHLRMVREHARELDPQADRALLAVLSAWCPTLERNAQHYLDRARSHLQGTGYCLLQ